MSRCIHLLPLLARFILGATSLAAQPPPSVHEPLYPVFEGGRWGMISPSGRLVLPPQFEKVARWPSSWNPANFPEPAHAAISVGSPIPIEDAVISVLLNGKAGVATRDGRVLALGEYESIEDFHEGRAWVRVGGRFGVIDEEGILVGSPRDLENAQQFRGGYAFVKAGGRWGVVDRDGLEVLPPTWDELALTSTDSLMAARTGKLWGLIERSGTTLIPPRFEKIGRPLPPMIFAVEAGQPVYVRPDGTIAFRVACPREGEVLGTSFFTEKSAVVRCGDRDGLIDVQGNFLLEPEWDGIMVHLGEPRYQVWHGDQAGLVDDVGQFVTPLGPRFRYCGRGLKVYEDSDRRDGLATIEGRVIIPPRFGSLDCFDDHGMALASTGPEEGFKKGFVDSTGVWVVEPQYREANPFRGPLATVSRPLGEATTELAYIDRSGRVVYWMRHRGFSYDQSQLRWYR